MSCRAQIIQLLKNIADARQWETTATAYPKLLNHRENPVAWERAARQAVRARRDGLERRCWPRATARSRGPRPNWPAHSETETRALHGGEGAGLPPTHRHTGGRAYGCTAQGRSGLRDGVAYSSATG